MRDIIWNKQGIQKTSIKLKSPQENPLDLHGNFWKLIRTSGTPPRASPETLLKTPKICTRTLHSLVTILPQPPRPLQGSFSPSQKLLKHHKFRGSIGPFEPNHKPLNLRNLLLKDHKQLRNLLKNFTKNHTNLLKDPKNLYEPSS